MIVHEPSCQRIADALLDVGAVSFQPHSPFTWASGIVSPVYCDIRLTLSHTIVRRAIADGFEEMVRTHIPGAEGIAGTATGGIAQAALLAERLTLPMVYVRSSAKGHGKQNLIEGRTLPSQRTVVVEDTVSTGGSVLQAVAALRAQEVDVRAVLAVFAYGFEEAEAAFATHRVPLFVLTDFASLLRAAVERSMLSPEQALHVEQFARNPRQWQAMTR